MLIRPALYVFPDTHCGDFERRRLMSEVDLEDSGLRASELMPPPSEQNHWRAVWDGLAKAGYRSRERDMAWEDVVAALKSLTKGFDVGRPRASGTHRLIAQLPLSADGQGRWCAIYFDEQAFDDWTGGWALDESVVRVELFKPSGDAPPMAVWHWAVRDLVPVAAMRFEAIDAALFVGEPPEDEKGGEGVWFEVPGFERLPTRAEDLVLNQLMSSGSRVGGFEDNNAVDMDVRCPTTGDQMVYALHLAADFFDSMFGDAGILHVWVSPKTEDVVVMADSA